MPAPSTAIPVFSASGLTVRYSTQTLLDNATLALHEGERVGLLGRNGCGKSTFLRIAAGELEPDSGEVTLRRNLLTGWLPQTFSLQLQATVQSNIIEGAKHLLELFAEYERLPADSARSSELLDEIALHDGWNLDTRQKSLISNLRAPAADRIAAELSGGEKRRVALCRALIAQPNLLILDEPTNHLDTQSVEWLENFLSGYSGTCLFVTHDRFFLDRIATRIIELKSGQFFSYPGNYQQYLQTKAEREATDEMQEHRRQKFLAKELEWVRRGPSARRTKSVDRIARYHDLAAQDGPDREEDVDLVIPPPPKLGNKILELRDVGVKIGNRTLFDRLTLELPEAAHVGIVGRNGAGKTTLLRIILGEQTPDFGEVVIGTKTVINYVDQNREILNEDDTVLSAIAGKSDWVILGEQRIHIRSYLRRFLFSDEAINSKVAHLSGGERSRLTLAKILLRGGNFLILDEPTNDLDLSTLQLLEEGLAEFCGCVLVVSHDRWFLNRVCTHILAFEEDGRVDFHVGNYDRYLEKRILPAGATKPAKADPQPPAKKRQRKLSYKEQRELDGMETDILAAENTVLEIEASLCDPTFYATRSREFPALEASLQLAKADVSKLYARWEELESIHAD